VRDTLLNEAGELLLDPGLKIGMTCIVLNLAGTLPWLWELFHMEARGAANVSLHFFRRMAGIPSGPAAALEDT
jgi:hypothetical protein